MVACVVGRIATSPMLLIMTAGGLAVAMIKRIQADLPPGFLNPKLET
jgi:hypothetical protein